MKVPPKSPTYSKDRTQTRRTVKGAAGGMIGVDYEDPRHNDPNTLRAHTEKGTAGAGSNRAHAVAAEAPAAAAIAREAREAVEPKDIGGPKEEQEMVLDDEDATTRDAKKRERARFVARDRLTVDKDAPELRRNKELWKKLIGDEDDEEAGEGAPEGRPAPDPEELDVGSIGEAIASAGDDAPMDRAALFAKPGRARIGDPSLVDPEQIRRAVRTPIAYAKHVMVLGEAFANATGARRDEVVRYMAAMYAALPDRRFARQALKEFGPSTGILDVYPLEVMEELVLRYPGSLPKVGFGRLFVRPTQDPNAALDLVEGKSTVIGYPKNLKVRGFAVKGGQAPGYLFEPDETPGHYRLRIDAPGRYTVMISALTKSGHAIVDRLRLNVRPAGRRPRAQAKPPEATRPREEAKVRAWPHPKVPAPDLSQLLERAAEKVQDSLLSMGELVSRQHEDSMRGPMGEAHEDFGFWPEDEPGPEDKTQDELPSPEPDPPALSLDEETEALFAEGDIDETETLSSAEQAILRLALATQVTADDLVALPSRDATPPPEAATEVTADALEPVTLHDASALTEAAGLPEVPEPLEDDASQTEDDEHTCLDVPAVPPAEASPEVETVHDAPEPETAHDAEPETAHDAEPDGEPRLDAPAFAPEPEAVTPPDNPFSAPLAELEQTAPVPPAPRPASRAKSGRRPTPPPPRASSSRPRGPTPAPRAKSQTAAPPPRPSSKADAPAPRPSSKAPRAASAPGRASSKTKPPRAASAAGRASSKAKAPRATSAPGRASSKTKAPRAVTPAPRPPSPPPTAFEPTVQPPALAAPPGGPSPKDILLDAARAPTPPPEPAAAAIDPMQTAVVRVRSAKPKYGRPPPSAIGPAVRLSSPMDDATEPEASGPPSSGGFVAAQAPMPPTALGETDSEVPVYSPPTPEPTPSPGPTADTPTAIPVDDLVLDED